MARRRGLRWGRVATLALGVAAVLAINWVSDWSFWRLYCALFSRVMWGA